MMAAEVEQPSGFFTKERRNKIGNYGTVITLLLVVISLIVALNIQGGGKGDALADAAAARRDAAAAREDAAAAQQQLANFQFTVTCYSKAGREANLALLTLLSLYRSQPTPEQADAAYRAVQAAKAEVEATATECGDEAAVPSSSTTTSSG